jgi:hypothetical protein
MYKSSLETAMMVKKHHQTIIEAPLKLDVAQNLYIRFWVKDYANDMIARTHLLVIQSSYDHQTLHQKYTDIFRHIRALNGNWALVEIELQPKQKNQIIKVLFSNPTLAGANLYFDDISVSQLSW